MPEIGFIGLRTMGNPMGKHLLDSGHDLIGFDIAREALEWLADAGATPARNPKEAIAGGEVVFLSLPGATEVSALAEEMANEFEPGTVLVDTTTSNPLITATIAERPDDRDVTVLGAPVSGGRISTEKGCFRRWSAAIHPSSRTRGNYWRRSREP